MDVPRKTAFWRLLKTDFESDWSAGRDVAALSNTAPNIARFVSYNFNFHSFNSHNLMIFRFRFLFHFNFNHAFRV